MSDKLNAPTAGRVLSTLNEDGSRRWMRPKLSEGRFLTRRRIVAYALMALFVLMPIIPINGNPAIFLDLPAREFHILGYTFLATDTVFLMLSLLATFLSIFWLTALFGRVWCGWGCPQTIYMEFVFRPLETLIEGKAGKQARLDKQRFAPRRILKYVAFFIVAMLMQTVFMSYFVRWSELPGWMLTPWEHPEAFLVMAVMTVMIWVDFAYFREQMCTVACPYARLQSVLVDRNSLIVGYDVRRGEPRTKGAKNVPEGSGDCISCKACVATCPTGIDIRDGMQLECIACTQCIDACDQVMDRIKRPRGLIRLSSQNKLEDGKKTQVLRPRVVIYPIVITIFLAAMIVVGANKKDADVTLLRGLAEPYTENGQMIQNLFRIKIMNRAKTARKFKLEFPGFPEQNVVATPNPMTVGAETYSTAPVFISAPRDQFDADGHVPLTIKVTTEDGFDDVETGVLLGPKNPK